jgi:hypothetical protein
VVILHFGFWPQKAKKNPKEPQEVLMRTINSAFWMKLNITLKNYHFAFHHFKVIGILHFTFYEELNTP